MGIKDFIDPLSGGASAAIGLGTAIAGKVNEKKAEGMAPALVDPNQKAMANLTRRAYRGASTGTGSTQDYKQGAAIAKMVGSKALMGGGRSMAPLLSMMKSTQDNIRAKASGEKLGLLGSLVKQEQDISDRKMDLQRLAQEKKHLKSQAQISRGTQNLYGGLGALVTGVNPESKVGGMLSGMGRNTTNPEK